MDIDLNVGPGKLLPSLTVGLTDHEQACLRNQPHKVTSLGIVADGRLGNAKQYTRVGRIPIVVKINVDAGSKIDRHLNIKDKLLTTTIVVDRFRRDFTEMQAVGSEGDKLVMREHAVRKHVTPFSLQG